MRTDRGYRKKCQRYNIPGHVHELTFSCYKNRAFFKSKEACDFLAAAVTKAAEKFQFELWAYVFMPNHVHLLIFPLTDPYSISAILHAIKLSVSKRMINHLRQSRPELLQYLATGRKDKKYMFWQDGGGYDRNLYNRDAIVNAIKYIHYNPVRRELVQKAQDWYYSSYKDWQECGSGPVKIDTTNFWL